MVTASGQEFDTVAMATAVHRMAALTPARRTTSSWPTSPSSSACWR